MPKAKLLKVFANPFAAEIDHEGRPCGAVKYAEKDHKSVHGQQPRFVGVKLVEVRKNEGPEGETPDQSGGVVHAINPHLDVSDWNHEWEYDTEPSVVPLNRYYMDALTVCGHHGPGLLPADVDTYFHVHGTREGFRDPRARLHQFVVERKAHAEKSERQFSHPRVKLSAEVAAKLARKVHPEATSEEKDYERKHEAEWMAFVKPALDAEAKAKADAAEAYEKAEAAKAPAPAPSA